MEQLLSELRERIERITNVDQLSGGSALPPTLAGQSRFPRVQGFRVGKTSVVGNLSGGDNEYETILMFLEPEQRTIQVGGFEIYIQIPGRLGVRSLGVFQSSPATVRYSAPGGTAVFFLRPILQNGQKSEQTLLASCATGLPI